MPGFLQWLSLMEVKDALSAAEPTVAPGAINVMTVHASKGLEFDAVAVPSLVVKDFPTEPRDREGWMGRTSLPYPRAGIVPTSSTTTCGARSSRRRRPSTNG